MDIETLKFTHISQSIEKLRGITVEEALTENLHEILTPKSAQFVLEEIKNQLRVFLADPGKFQYKTYELEHYHKDGHTIWVEIKVYFRINEKTGKVEAIGTSRNIDERVRVRKELEKSEKELKELNQTKDKFFSIIAHDLKSPFSGILGFTKLLLDNQDKYNPSKINNILQSLNSNAKAAYDLLENLLIWSQNQTGKLKYVKKQLKIYELIEKNIKFLQITANKKNILIKNLVDEAQMVYCDDNSIHAVIRNLLSNAIKFSYPGGTIKILSEPNGPDMVRITFSDDGVGIEEEKTRKLFNIDQSLSTKGTNDEKGTGLGLILCKEFVEKNDGEIWVESVLGKGSKFIFTLPTENNLANKV